MPLNLDSQYDCAAAGEDLHRLQDQLSALQSQSRNDKEDTDLKNQIENQIRFIKNKCDIRP